MEIRFSSSRYGQGLVYHSNRHTFAISRHRLWDSPMDPLKYFDSVDLRSLRKEAQGFHVYRGLRYDIPFAEQKATFLYKSYDLQQTHRKRNRFETLPDYMVGEPYQRGESSQDIEYSPPARITSLWNAFLEWLFQRERYELDLYLPNSMLPTAFDKNQLTAQQMSDILPEGALPSVTSLDDPAAVPLVVHVHGGGWMRGRHDIEWRGGVSTRAPCDLIPKTH